MTTEADGPRRTSRHLVVAALELVVGTGAIFGGYALLHDAEGFGLREGWLRGSPFHDYRVPGLFLLVVIGAGMCCSATMHLVRSRFAGLAAATNGLVLLVWLIVETAIIGFHGWAQVLLLLTMGFSGAVMLKAGLESIASAGSD